MYIVNEGNNCSPTGGGKQLRNVVSGERECLDIERPSVQLVESGDRGA